jgi:hypothetical protein
LNRRVFILRRDSGNTEVLTPFTPLELVEALEKNEVSGFFGSYPEMKEIDQVKGKLYIMGEEGSRLRLGEKTFYSRFGLSLLVFLGLFYLFTYLIPDPIPMVDEISLSLGGSILFSIWYRRKVERGSQMVQRRIDVKGYIDRIEFHESSLLKEMELYLETVEQKIAEKKLDELWNQENLRFTAEDGTGMTSEILKGLEQKIGSRTLSLFRRRMKKKERNLSLFDKKSLEDLPLALFYYKCREQMKL